MNPRIVTSMTYRESPPEYVPIDPQSETQPDMTMSLDELLARHTTGRGLNRDLSNIPDHLRFEGYFDDEQLDEFFPDINRLDMVEVQEMIDASMDHVTQLQYKLQKQQSEDFKAKMDAYHADKEKTSQNAPNAPKTPGKNEPTGDQSTNPS